MKTETNTRKQIVDTAERLFSHYGFHKTTMADIAGGCEMSPANIYRFFDSKEQILVEIAMEFFRAYEEHLRKVLKRKDMSPAQRLETLVVEKLRYHADYCKSKPKIDEAIEYLQSKHEDICMTHLDATHAIIAEIIAEGNRIGDFSCKDPMHTAYLIMTSTAPLFHHFIKGYCLREDPEKTAREIVRLIVQGLRNG